MGVIVRGLDGSRVAGAVVVVEVEVGGSIGRGVVGPFEEVIIGGDIKELVVKDDVVLGARVVGSISRGVVDKGVGIGDDR